MLWASFYWFKKWNFLYYKFIIKGAEKGAKRYISIMLNSFRHS